MTSEDVANIEKEPAWNPIREADESLAGRHRRRHEEGVRSYPQRPAQAGTFTCEQLKAMRARA